MNETALEVFFHPADQSGIEGLLGGGNAQSLISRKPISYLGAAVLLVGTPLLGLLFVIAVPLGGFAALLLMAAEALGARDGLTVRTTDQHR